MLFFFFDSQWATGAVLGPMIGGSLADPITNHPNWFKGEPPVFFKRFPFALPNIVASIFFIVGLAIGILFLDVREPLFLVLEVYQLTNYKETLETKKDKPDIGRRLGHGIARFFRPEAQHHKNITDETTSLLQSQSSSSLDEELAIAQRKQASKAQDAPPIRDAFTFQSSVNLIVYCVLALHAVTFDQLLPVLMAYPPTDPSQHRLPLKFAGGLGMTSSEVGFFFSVYGGIGMFLQVSFHCHFEFLKINVYSFLLKLFIFPPITNKLGALRCLRLSSFTFPIVYALIPFVVILPHDKQSSALFTLMFFRSLAGIFAFPCSTILLTNSSPTLRLLGTLNGIAVTLSALGRAIGPAVSSTTSSKELFVIIDWRRRWAVLCLAGVRRWATLSFRGGCSLLSQLLAHCQFCS